ncbi:MAG: hypothetical protein JWQ70_2888, partial [Aeromicrobium sp.]|nr:hypothetical protein [Aeromicrobium sp.]
MRRVSVALVASVSFLVMWPNVASGDVHVKPKRNESSILLSGLRTSKNESHPAHQAASGTHPRRPKFLCFPDQFNLGTQCAPSAPAKPGQPVLTEGAILQAVREIGLPSLKVRIQPGTSTLVNIPTIFYTQPQAF